MIKDDSFVKQISSLDSIKFSYWLQGSGCFGPSSVLYCFPFSLSCYSLKTHVNHPELEND